MMKASFCSLVCLLAASFTVPIESRAESGWAPGVYLSQAVDEMLLAVRLLSDETAFGYDSDGVCLAGVYLREKQVHQLERPFQRGVTYAIIAGGDRDTVDVDVEILDERGQRLAGDILTDRMAVVEFTPSRSARYTVRLTLYKSRRDAFCSFAILRHGGFDVPAVNLHKARISLLGMCMGVLSQADQYGLETGFLTRPSQAAVFGYVLPSGASRSLGTVNLGSQPTFIVAGGDFQATDLDLYLRDSTGRVLAKDIAFDALPTIPYLPTVGRDYTIELKNESGNGRAAFALCGVLQVQ